MHHECPKYPKNLINDQNILKPSKMTTLPPSPPQKKTFQMTKIPLKPHKKQKQNTLKNSKNEENTPKPKKS